MVYILYSLEKFLIGKEINSIKEKNKIDDINISVFDLNQNSIQDILDDAETFSMFADKKMIIVNNSYIFTSKKSEDKLDNPKLENYLNNPNPNTILIFVLNEDKLDERKKITKIIKKFGIVKELLVNDLNSYVTDLFGDYKITRDDVKLFIDRVGNDLNTINQEINKIKIYKENDLKINSDDILNLTCENIESDLFSLVDQIINKNTSSALVTYNKLIKLGEEPINIINNIAIKIRSIYQTKELYNKGYKENDIASILGVKPGYLYYMKNSLKKYDSKTLLSILEKLIDLDYKIKRNMLDKNNALELFILEMS